MAVFKAVLVIPPPPSLVAKAVSAPMSDTIRPAVKTKTRKEQLTGTF